MARGRQARPILERFNERFKLDSISDCWLWTGPLTPDGYGNFQGKRPSSAHRVSWELHRGEIPKDTWVRQNCDNHHCVNPSHLFLTTSNLPRFTPRERFEKSFFIEPNSGCWLWEAYTMPNGYGLFSIGYDRGLAHRHAWEIYNGEIPDNLCVLHKCDTPACVRPDHLFLGTNKDNSQDMVRKRRHIPNHNMATKTHCLRGHSFSNENTRVDAYGHRICITCKTIKAHERYIAKIRPAHLTGKPLRLDKRRTLCAS